LVSEQVYKKSLQYELNQRAAVIVHTDGRSPAAVRHAVERHDVHADSSDGEPGVALDFASESEQNDDELLEHDNEHGGRKRVRTPPSVWDARKKSQTSYICRACP
jgi:hypothetical protein